MDAERQEMLIDEVAGRIRKWGMISPSIAFLEANKPFSFLGSQFLLFAQPLLDMFLSRETAGEYATLLEDRENVERLIRKLETGAG